MRILLAVAMSVSLVGAAVGEVVKVSIGDMTFSPMEITARVGDTVEWTNSDFVDHTATAKDGDWDVTLPAGQSGRVVLKRAGITAYYCRFHPNMTGTIRIVAIDPR